MHHYLSFRMLIFTSLHFLNFQIGQMMLIKQYQFARVTLCSAWMLNCPQFRHSVVWQCSSCYKYSYSWTLTINFLNSNYNGLIWYSRQIWSNRAVFWVVSMWKYQIVVKTSSRLHELQCITKTILKVWKLL